jgi:hypothetical protein
MLGSSFLVFEDARRMGPTRQTVHAAAAATRTYFHEEGRWPTSFVQIAELPPLCLVGGSTHARDSWGNPLLYVAYDRNRGYGQVICSGPRGKAHRVITRFREAYEWRFDSSGDVTFQRK